MCVDFLDFLVNQSKKDHFCLMDRLPVLDDFFPLFESLAGESKFFFVSCSKDETCKASAVLSSCTCSSKPHNSSI